ncbi:membrane protein insertase YidC, partial [Xanthomonas oryzae pv. oryzae]
MNQTRVFLIFAWLMVAALLWMEWGKEKAAANAPGAAATQSVPAARDLDAATPSAANVPAAQPIAQAGAPGTVPATSTTTA